VGGGGADADAEKHEPGEHRYSLRGPGQSGSTATTGMDREYLPPSIPNITKKHPRVTYCSEAQMLILGSTNKRGTSQINDIALEKKPTIFETKCRLCFTPARVRGGNFCRAIL